jgi:ribosomal-protein-alanine N-acetyltransferase
MTPPTSIETSRLRLRVPRVDDAPALFEAYATDPEVTRYLAWRPHTRVAETEWFLRNHCETGWAASGPYPWMICLAETGAPVGMIDLRPSGHSAEIGYALARRHWGRGLMPEAARAVTHWAIAQPEIERVWAVCDVDNLASARVLEKIGMWREGLLRAWTVHPNMSPRPRDVWSFSRVKERAA